MASKTAEKVYSISCFNYHKGSVEICFHNPSLTDTVVVPNLYLRQRKLKNKFVLRGEFYKVSDDTLYLKLSRKPALTGVSTSHKIDGLFIEGVYNDYKLAPNATKIFRIQIAQQHKMKVINVVNVLYDDYQTIGVLKRNN